MRYSIQRKITNKRKTRPRGSGEPHGCKAPFLSGKKGPLLFQPGTDRRSEGGEREKPRGKRDNNDRGEVGVGAPGKK